MTLKQLNSTRLFLEEYHSDEGFAAALEKAKELANELEIVGVSLMKNLCVFEGKVNNFNMNLVMIPSWGRA